VRRPAAITAVLCAALAGCSSGSNEGVTLPKGGTTATDSADTADTAGGALTYRGSTSQRQRLRIDTDGKLLAKFRLLLRCRDGTQTHAAIATVPHRPSLQPDGSFYYSEVGRATFSPYGDGRYRVAMAGQLQGTNGAGHASFRISFKSTACRASVSWQARRI
jgi:hypothetical protein